MAASAKVRELKLLLGGLEAPETREILSTTTLACGIPRGAIIELIGPHKTEWLLHFMKEQSDLKIFWSEKKQSLLPTAISQRGIDLSRITFATLENSLVLPIRKVIQSQLYQIVIAPSEFTEIKILKALQLFTEKSNCILFLIAKDQLSQAWPISMQLEIQQQEMNFNITIHKQKHGRE